MLAVKKFSRSLIHKGILADQEVAHVFSVSCVSRFIPMSVSNVQG